MAATPSVSETQLTPHSRVMLQLARRAIQHGLVSAGLLPITETDFPAVLQMPGAAFVTLHRHRQLRGCIGNLEPRQSLVREIAANAYGAAFQDPRFDPLTIEEVDDLHIEISVLTPKEPIIHDSEAELLATLQPGIDGLVLVEGRHRSTFLPAVWEQLPDPQQFLAQLKRKAGLPADHQSATLEAYRYRTVSFGE